MTAKEKPNEPEDQKNSEDDKSEEFKNFENFASKIFSVTRKELDEIFEKEKKSGVRKKRKTRRK